MMSQRWTSTSYLGQLAAEQDPDQQAEGEGQDQRQLPVHALVVVLCQGRGHGLCQKPCLVPSPCPLLPLPRQQAPPLLV